MVFLLHLSIHDSKLAHRIREWPKVRCLIAFDSKGFPLQKCIEKLGQLRCKLGAENGESKKAGCGKTAPKFSQEDDRYCQIVWKHSKEATKTVLFFFKTSGGRFYLASTHAWFAWDQSWFFPSFVRYCNLRMPTCINNAPWQRFALCVARDVLASASGESEVEAQVILKSRVEVPPSQLP